MITQEKQSHPRGSGHDKERRRPSCTGGGCRPRRIVSREDGGRRDAGRRGWIFPLSSHPANRCSQASRAGRPTDAAPRERAMVVSPRAVVMSEWGVYNAAEVTEERMERLGGSLECGGGRTSCSTPTLPSWLASILRSKPRRQHRNVCSRTPA